MSRKPRVIETPRQIFKCTTCRIPELADWVEGCIEETMRVSGRAPQAKALWNAAVEEFDGGELPLFRTFYNHLQEHSAAWSDTHPKHRS